MENVESASLDGVQSIVDSEVMPSHVRKYRDYLAVTPRTPFYQKEFGFYSIAKWATEGMPTDVPLDELFGFDPPAVHSLRELGWCEAGFYPVFEEKIIEDRGEHEVVQDFAGRHVLCFKGRRDGFMPEYLDHPVKDQKTWEENCKWRMDPNSPERFADLENRMAAARAAAAEGQVISQGLVGGYMYLRSLIGPGELLYMVYDHPELIHDCMQTWFDLADGVIARHQQYLSLDEFFLAEDICYNHGSLISPDMIKEFLFPYYQQLIANIRSRQIDKQRELYIQVDTDGFADAVTDLYRDGIGMKGLSPFEVASNCDVVRTGQQYPDMYLLGGVDKRVLATDKKAIDAHLDSILPAMFERGGYIPTCDHGVPEEVPYENYLYYRKKLLEYA